MEIQSKTRIKIDENINKVNKRLDALNNALVVFENQADELTAFSKETPDEDIKEMIIKMRDILYNKMDVLENEITYLHMNKEDLLEKVNDAVNKAYDEMEESWTPVIVTAIS